MIVNDKDNAQRAVTYARKSSDDPRRPGKSVRDQLTSQRRLAEREGWQVVAQLQDDGIGASRHSRKVARAGFLEVLRLVDDGEVDVVSMEELSRATRQLGIFSALLDSCADAGLELWVAGRRYDPDDPTDRLALGITAVVDAAEADRTRKRVQRGVREAAADGRPHGRLLYGYRREYDPTSGELIQQVADERTAPVVQELVRRVAAGETTYAIARDLTRRGIATPTGGGTWDPMQIKRTALNPGYVGQRVFRGRVIGPAAWDVIVDETDWAVAQRILTDPARGGRRDSTVKSLLSGLARCGVCGGKMRALSPRGVPSYVCYPGGPDAPGRFHTARHREPTDARVIAAVVARLSAPDLAGTLAEQQGHDVTAALSEVELLKVRLDGFVDAAAAGELTPAALARIEAQLLPSIEAAQARVRTATMSPVVAATAGPDAGTRFAALSLPQQREIISSLAVVRILPVGRGKRIFNPDSVEVTWR